MTRHPRPLPPATIENVSHEATKLCRYVDSLAKSVARLADRIQPYDGEAPPEIGVFLTESSVKRTSTLADLVKIIAAADRRLEEIEHCAKFVKAQMDQISNDSWLRDDLRPYLDNKSRPKKKP